MANRSPDIFKEIFNGLDNVLDDWLGVAPFNPIFEKTLGEDLALANVVNKTTRIPKPDAIFSGIHNNISSTWQGILNASPMAGGNPNFNNIADPLHLFSKK